MVRERYTEKVYYGAKRNFACRSACAASNDGYKVGPEVASSMTPTTPQRSLASLASGPCLVWTRRDLTSPRRVCRPCLVLDLTHRPAHAGCADHAWSGLDAT